MIRKNERGEAEIALINIFESINVNHAELFEG